jgi:hypothetical protein
MKFAATIDQVIQQHLAELQKPGVLSIRPGYEASGGWLTNKPAIVVTVDRKRDDLGPDERLPEKLGGFAVDVREASPLHVLRASNPSLYAQVAASALPELQRPFFDFERDATGHPVAPLAAAVAAAKQPAKTTIKYTAPAGVRLDPIDDNVTITCHASPDAGWTTLQPFLTGTKKGLTIAMYEFTAPYIVDAVKGVGKPLTLVLDDPHDKVRDQTEDETRQQLSAALGARLTFAWALEGADPHVTAEIYPSAYHIKVAVRDGTSFWLSSGNFNRSNQPDVDPIQDPNTDVSAYDRDWHVIVEHPGLSQVFEAYIKHDLTEAAPYQSGQVAGAAVLAALSAQARPERTLQARAPKQYFAPKTISAKMKIQPVLTPDNYAGVVLPLISGTKKSFWMQTQYMHPAQNFPGQPQDPATLAGSDAVLESLIGAVAELIRQGRDVRLIMSQYETLDLLELLKERGIDQSHIKIQPNVHNKGMVIDSSIVVVGSQNWSGQGVSTNRDASLVIYNAEAAQYWEQIFTHDWTSMASQHALD